VSGRPPNILLVVVHDLGTRLGCYGHGSVPSPHLDRLAEGGVRFTRNFCTAPYCSPSRGSVITGRYPHVNGLMGLVNLGWEWRGQNVTLAKALGERGYDTYLFGLQHEARDKAVDALGFQHVSDRSLSRKGSAVAPLVEEFLAGRGNERRPFYARVGFSEVHRPFTAYEPTDPATVSLPDWAADTPGAREDFAQYDGCIRAMDAAVGRILAALEQAGSRDGTLVVFTNDHGSPFPRAKATLYDAGIHTTLLMRWPGGFQGGRALSELISNVDLFPTVLEAAGAGVPENIQGRSFLPLLRGTEYVPRDLVFAEKNTNPTDVKRCVRGPRFKYIRNYHPGPELLIPTDSEISPTRRDMGNDHLRPRPEVELYDLVEDPTERTNLAGRPECAGVERSLAERLRTLQTETADPVLDGAVGRPATEEAILRRAYEATLARCPFPRDDLVCAYHDQRERSWAFADPRANTVTPQMIAEHPERLTTPIRLRGGESFVFRSLRKDDGARLGRYFEGLSEQTRGWFGPHDLSAESAQQLAQDSARAGTLRLVAVTADEDEPGIVAYFILQLGVRLPDQERFGAWGLPVYDERDCTLAPSVADAHQNRGLGSALMRATLELARRAGRKRMVLWGGVPVANRRAVHFYEKFGFREVGRFGETAEKCDMVLDLRSAEE